MKGKTLGAFVKFTVFAVVTTFVTLILGFTIANGSTSAAHNYKADFTEVTGLLPGDDVRVAGVRVGQVKNIQIADRKYARVTFAVEKGVPVRQSTLAKIRYRNLVGQRYLELDEAPGNDAPMPDGSVIPLSRTQPAVDLTVLFNGFRPLFQALTPNDVNKLSYEIIATLQGEGGTIDSLLSHTASLTNTIADRDAEVGQVIDNLNTVLGVVDQRNQDLSQLILQLQRLVSGLAGNRDAIAASLTNIDSLAASTSGLLEQIRPPLPSDLAALSQLSKTLAQTKNPDGTLTLETVLRNYPSKLNTIIRTATYGSFFNFWLCDFDAVSSTPNGATVQYPAPGKRFHVNDPSCNAGGGQ